MALTLVEAAKLNSGNVLRSGIIELFAMSSDILRTLPFESITGNALRYNQEEALPGVAFRGINEGYTESTGIINPMFEPLVIAGGDLDVDKFIIDTMGTQQRSTQTQMKVKALAQSITYKFIKGDSSSSPKEFDGLQRRLVGTQLLANGSTDGGDALSLAKLDEVIDRVDNPNALFMSKAMRRHLTVAARKTTVGGQIDYTVDEFGKQVTMYAGLPILISDNSDQATAATAFNEVGSTGSTATATSIYVLSLGDQMLEGIQNGTMDVRDMGELESKPVFRTRVEWYVGLTLYNPRAAARLYGISNAAAVA